MLTLATRFAVLVANLRAAVATFAARRDQGPGVVWLGTLAFAPIGQPNLPPPIPTATWVLLHDRLGRMASRFQALFDRWRAGTLPTPRPSRARPSPAGRSRAPHPCRRLPAARAWVARRLPEASPFVAHLNTLLADESCAAFLAAAPQAGRILRPLAHLLGTPLPPGLTRPRRPRAPRPHKPAPPPPATPQCTPDRPLPAYVRATARAWKNRAA